MGQHCLAYHSFKYKVHRSASDGYITREHSDLNLVLSLRQTKQLNMVSKTIIVLAALCFAQTFAKPSGDDNLQKLAANVQSIVDTFTAEMKKTFDIKETKESKQIVDTLKTNANDFAGKLSDLLTTLNKEAKAHSGDVNTAIEALKTKVSETVKKIQEDHPAEAAKAQEYQKKIEATYTELYSKAREAADALGKDTSSVHQELHHFTEGVINGVKENLEKANQEIKKALDEHQKEHKH